PAYAVPVDTADLYILRAYCNMANVALKHEAPPCRLLPGTVGSVLGGANQAVRMAMPVQAVALKQAPRRSRSQRGAVRSSRRCARSAAPARQERQAYRPGGQRR